MGMLFLLIAFVVLMPSSSTQLTTTNLQEIKLVGYIMSADAILKEIESAQKDKNIKGVLLNVDSPGGAVPPSIEIAYAIKELKKHKPVIAYASGIMAGPGLTTLLSMPTKSSLILALSWVLSGSLCRVQMWKNL